MLHSNRSRSPYEDGTKPMNGSALIVPALAGSARLER
jgi:hypothetical protein